MNDFLEFVKNKIKNNIKVEKINLILLKKIGQTTKPNKYKISSKELKKLFYKII